MEPGGFIAVGKVMKTHGLKGEVAVAPAGDLPFTLLQGLEVWFVPPPATVRSARIESVRPGPKGPVVGFSGVSGIDQARALTGAEVLAKEADLPSEWTEVEEEFDPVGMSVFDEVHGDLGEVVEVIVTGANDVLVVEGRLGEVLVPVIDDVILGIDEESDSIDVRLLPGLLPGDDA